MDARPAPGAFLITGVPGAGKTTVAQLLAGRFDRGARIEADAIHELIVAGGLWPDAEPREEALVVLAPALEVALARDEARGCKRVGERWAHLHAEQRAKLGGHGLWLDTSELTAEETVDAILDRLPGY